MMKIRTNGPCKGCTDRTEFGACHSTCEKYIDYKKKVQEYNDKVAAKKRDYYDPTNFSFRRIKRER